MQLKHTEVYTCLYRSELHQQPLDSDPQNAVSKFEYNTKVEGNLQTQITHCNIRPKEKEIKINFQLEVNFMQITLRKRNVFAGLGLLLFGCGCGCGCWPPLA